MAGENMKHLSISLGLLIAVVGIALIATPALADNPELTAQSFECQKHLECGSDKYWETQETFKNQFAPTVSSVNPAFKRPCFNLNPSMSHPEVHPGPDAIVGYTYPVPFCPCES
jgi:hypothetical protein